MPAAQRNKFPCPVALYRYFRSALCLLLSAFLALAILPAAVFSLGETRIVRVGYNNEYGIFSKPGSEEYSGYVYDYLKEIAKYSGWVYEYVPGTWEECLDRLESGEIDLLGPIQYSPERAQIYDFCNQSIGNEYGALYTSNSRRDLYYEDFDAYNGMTVGIVEGNSFNDAFRAYCIQHDFRVDYVTFENTEDLARSVDTGQTDAFVCGSLLDAANAKVLGKFSNTPFFFATTKGNFGVLSELNSAIEDIQNENMFFNSTLYSRFFQDSTINHPAFTREEADFLAQSPVLRMVYDPAWPPMGFEDADTGEFSGISAELIQLMVERCGIRLEYISTESYEASLQSMQAGDADLLSGHISDSEQASRYGMRLTDPYIELPVVAVGKPETVLNRGMKIAIPKDFSQTKSYVDKHYSDAQELLFPSTQECIDAVQQSRASLTLINSYEFTRISQEGNADGLSILSVTDVASPMCIGVASHVDPIVISILNKAIAQITSEELNQCILTNTMQGTRRPTFLQILKAYGPQLIIAGVILLTAAGLFLFHNMKKTERRLRKIAYTDALTGIRSLEKFRLDAQERMAENAGPYALLYVDIDRFKDINDTFGYEAGNQALQYTARILTETLPEGDLLGRISADNFVALVREESQQELTKLTDSLFEKAAHFTLDRQEPYLLVLNCGIYSVKPGDRDIHTIIDRANAARKSSKGNHMSSYAVYDEQMHQRMVQEKEIEGAMEAALQDREFVVFLQPKYSLSDGAIVGAEALVRWQRPGKGLIPPMDFIPLFEKNGFIISLDFFVFEEVCRKINQWLSQGKRPVPISVNFSRLHLHSSNFIERFGELIRRYRIPPELIELELTETVVMDSLDDLLVIMRRLKENGFTLSMDDFGTGYSSLNLLKELPVDILKLDRAFFAEDHATLREKIIIQNIVNMSKQLGIRVISEGVETQTQVDFLKEVGCDMAQGYFFARPMPIKEFERLAFHQK